MQSKPGSVYNVHGYLRFHEKHNFEVMLVIRCFMIHFMLSELKFMDENI